MACFDALSDDLLVTVFDLLRHNEDWEGEVRRSSDLFAVVPLVCRRWHRLSRSPQLLQDLVIDIMGVHPNLVLPAGSLLPRLRSLCGWMTHAAGHARVLELRVGPDDSMSADDRAEAEALLAGIVSLSGAAGSLQELELYVSLAMRYSSWLLSLSKVHALKITSFRFNDDEEEQQSGSRLVVPLCGLTSCERLHLSDMEVEVPPGPVPALPSSLTCLELHELGAYLPSQVDCLALPRLIELTLYYSALDASAFEPLTSLPALENLVLWSCASLLACLARIRPLLGLQIIDTLRVAEGALDVDNVAARCDELSHALAPLAGQLTGLGVVCSYLFDWPPPLSAFSRLESLIFAGTRDLPLELPIGPWLHSLRGVALDVQTAASSMATLAACTRLEGLAVQYSSVQYSSANDVDRTALRRHASAAGLGTAAPLPASPGN